jgi:hypothetical protein
MQLEIAPMCRRLFHHWEVCCHALWLLWWFVTPYHHHPLHPHHILFLASSW